MTLRPALYGSRLFRLGLFAATRGLSSKSFALYKAWEARRIIGFPKAWEIPLNVWISAAMTGLVNDASFGLFTIRQLTRFISATIGAPFRVARSALTEGFSSGQDQQAIEIAPSLSWVAVVAILVAVGHFAKDWNLALIVGICFVYLAVFGQWQSAMVTLASVLAAVPIGVAAGLALGILACRSALAERMMRPVPDLMQTVPVFANLVPILALSGFGPVSALVATVIFAMPPMVRVSTVVLQTVPPEII